MTVIEEFEKEFCRFTGAKYAVAVCNGTSALHVALMALGVCKGDGVITTPFTHISTVNAILYCGAHPLFADINRENFCIDPQQVAKVLHDNSDVKAILCVHLFGNVCNLASLRVRADHYGVKLVEDCAQAFGRTYTVRGKKTTTVSVGRMGDIGTFSFYASKNLWTFEGGMLVTDNDELAKKARLLRSHGQESKYYHTVLGYNYRMPQICALIGLTALKLHKKGIVAELGSYGIEQGHYPCVVYEQPAYQKLGITGNCPVAESVAKKAREYFEKLHGKWGKQ